MRILQVNTADVGGGAEAVARQLFEGYRSRGHWSRLAVGVKYTDDPHIVALPRAGEGSLVDRAARHFAVTERVARGVRDPLSVLARLRGSEDVTADASWSMLTRVEPQPPDILHCHNLHGSSYFDLRALPALSRRVPLVLTLHDAWLLSGHCAHSLDCDRWLIGCGHCPDLTLYPAIRRDNTAANLARKRDIFARTRAYVSAPSVWLLDRARRSILAGSIVEGRVIPNGVDTDLFAPADRGEARTRLGLPIAARVLLFIAPGGPSNRWKDQPTLRAALERPGRGDDGPPIICLVLGHGGTSEQVGRVEFRYVNAEADPRRVACLYQAADVYVHASRVDTFPLAVLEALACGTPVVASAVGGIPEQITHLAIAGLTELPGIVATSQEKATGVLVPAGDAVSLRTAIAALLGDPELRAALGANARNDVLQRFKREQMVDRWLAWYAEILASRQ